MTAKNSSSLALKKLLDVKTPADPTVTKLNDLLKEYQRIEPKNPKRGRGRPAKLAEDKVQVISLKMPPKMIKFLDELILPHPKAKGRGGKIRYMMVQFVKMKKREIAQLRILVGQLKDFDKHLSHLSMTERHDGKEMRSLSERINSLRAMVELYKIEMKDYKRMLKAEDFRLLELAIGFNMSAVKK